MYSDNFLATTFTSSLDFTSIPPYYLGMNSNSFCSLFFLLLQVPPPSHCLSAKWFNYLVLISCEICPQPGDYVRIHVLDAEEASLFLQEDRYLVGVVVAPIAVHDSSTVSVIGLTGAELLLVPNTRMEFVTAENGARVEEIFKVSRNKVRGGVVPHNTVCTMWFGQA